MSSKFVNYGYHELNIDVNMIAQIDSNWTSFNDYMNALNSKFRTKTKQVFKKSENLDIIDFNIITIKERLSEIEELYNHMVDRSSFSFGRLNANTLLKFKENLGKAFYFKGYLLNDKLIGFATATRIDKELDGNFIGIHHQYNKDYSVYQRILYDFITCAIDEKLKTVRLGRTAEEIKSGVGAMPNEMKFYAKHQNRFKNSIIKPFLSLLRPSEFNLRRPYKKRNMIKKGA
jgi:predicted N-acyltransferase